MAPNRFLSTLLSGLATLHAVSMVSAAPAPPQHAHWQHTGIGPRDVAITALGNDVLDLAIPVQAPPPPPPASLVSPATVPTTLLTVPTPATTLPPIVLDQTLSWDAATTTYPLQTTTLANGTEVRVQQTESNVHDVHVEQTVGEAPRDSVVVHVKVFVEHVVEKVRRGLGKIPEMILQARPVVEEAERVGDAGAARVRERAVDAIPTMTSEARYLPGLSDPIDRYFAAVLAESVVEKRKDKDEKKQDVDHDGDADMDDVNLWLSRFAEDAARKRKNWEDAQHPRITPGTVERRGDGEDQDLIDTYDVNGDGFVEDREVAFMLLYATALAEKEKERKQDLEEDTARPVVRLDSVVVDSPSEAVVEKRHDDVDAMMRAADVFQKIAGDEELHRKMVGAQEEA